MELLDAVRSVRRHWKTAVAILVLSFVAVGVYVSLTGGVARNPTYTASAQILVPKPDKSGNWPEGLPASLYNGLRAAQQPATRQAAIEELQLNEQEREKLSFGANINEDGDIVTLQATAGSREGAEAAVDAFERSYNRARRETFRQARQGAANGASAALENLRTRRQAIEAELDNLGLPIPDTAPSQGSGGSSDDAEAPAVDLPASAPPAAQLLVSEHSAIQQRIAQLQKRYASASLDALTPQGFTEVINRTGAQEVETEELSPLIPIAGILGLGLLLALAVPVARDRLDHSIKSSDTAAAALGAPVLAAIPPTRAERTLATPGTPRAAAYRSLAAIAVATERLPRAIMVTSPTGKGHDAVAANFATALAELGLRVALVPTSDTQSWFLPERAPDRIGQELATLPQLLDQAYHGKLNGAVGRSFVPGDIDNLRILAPGSSDDVERALDGLPSLLHVLSRSDFDITVIAGPSMSDDPNATIFAWAVRNVLWAVRAGEVTDAQAQEVAARMELAGVAPFGVVLIGHDD